MTSRNYSVAPHEGGWQVKRDGAHRASNVFETKDKALDRGRELARESGGELRIKGRRGTIQDSDSYGNDPFPPRDKKH